MNLRRLSRLAAFAVLAIGGALLSWMIVEFVREKLQPDNDQAAARFKQAIDYAALAPTPRLPLGEPVIGDARADYEAFDAPRSPFGKYRGGPPTPEQVQALRDPQVARVVDAFVRASRREERGHDLNPWKLLRRARMVTIGAMEDISHGRRQEAWQKALALYRAGHDALEASTFLPILVFSELPTGAIASTLAKTATAEEAENWQRDIETLLLDQRPDGELAAAVALSNARDIAKFIETEPAEDLELALRVGTALAQLASDLRSQGVPPQCSRAMCVAAQIDSSSCERMERTGMRSVAVGDELRSLRATLAARLAAERTTQ